MSDNFFDFDSNLLMDKQAKGTYVKTEDTNMYDPKPSEGKGGVYKSVLRFVRYEKDHSYSKYKKYVAKLYNPLTKERLFIDCPSSDGKTPSILWSIETVIYGLKNTEPEIHKELSANFSRWYSYFSPVYIKRDPQKESLEGSVKWFKYGVNIAKMIRQQLEPEQDLIESSAPVNPFHYLNGKDFIYCISKKNKEFNDYSASKFVDTISPFAYKIGDKEITVQNDAKVIELTQSFLLKNTPDITPYVAKPWTEEDYKKVASFIKAAIPYKELIQRALDHCKDEKIHQYLKVESGVVNSPLASDVSFNSAKTSTPVPAKDDFFEEKPSVSNVVGGEPSSTTSNEFDDLLKNL